MNMNNIAKNIRRILKRDTAGMTLVELIVSFALIGILMASSCLVISGTMNIYYRVKAMQNSTQAAELILDKVSGEIWGAQVGIRRVTADPDKESGQLHTFVINKDKNKIDLYDRTGSHIWIGTTDVWNAEQTDESKKLPAGRLLIHYYEVKSTNEAGLVTEVVLYNAVNWTYDEKNYLGYEIEELTFSRPCDDADTNTASQYAPNVICITLKLRNTRDTEQVYETKRYVTCYNFTSQDDYDKMKVEE